jgi:uncharacterized membrane protein (UPF0127 family)
VRTLRPLFVYAALSGVLWTSACEPRVDEPLPPAATPATVKSAAPAAADTTPPSPSGLPTSAASPAESAAPPRCIRSTPKEPTRTARRGPDPRCPRDPEKVPQARKGRVTFVDATKSDGKDPSAEIEVAENEHDRQRGLMYRTSMAEDHGMIFRMGEHKNHTFWMHNTCISLDMLFIDNDGVIVGIEENTPTMDDSTFQVGCASTYVLELNAGWARKHGVVAGQRTRLDGVEP